MLRPSDPLWCLALAGVLTSVLSTASADEPEASHLAATFSIVAIDPQTGQCGAAVASKYLAVGKAVPFVRGGVGAFCTQHYLVSEWGPRALDLLEAEQTPEAVITQLLAGDSRPEQRQLAVIDMRGRTAVHNPTAAPKSSRYWAAMTGRNFACQGNTLAGRQVITAMAAAFEETNGSLADRLMAALVAGDRAGGDHRGRLAAGIRIAKQGTDGDWLALDVDASDDAVEELLEKYRELEHDAKGE